MYSLPLGGDCDRRVGLWAAAAGKNKRNEHAGADALTARAHAPPPGVILFYFILFYPFSPTAPIPRCCRTKGLGGPSAVAAGGLPLLGIDICATSTLRRVLCASPLAQVQRAGILLLPLLLLQRLRRRFRLLLVASHFSLPLAFRGLVFLLVAARTHTWGNVAGRDWWLDGMRGGGRRVGWCIIALRSLALRRASTSCTSELWADDDDDVQPGGRRVITRSSDDCRSGLARLGSRRAGRVAGAAWRSRPWPRSVGN